MLCRCKVIPLNYGSFVSVAVQISARHSLFISYRSMVKSKETVENSSTVLKVIVADFGCNR